MEDNADPPDMVEKFRIFYPMQQGEVNLVREQQIIQSALDFQQPREGRLHPGW